MSASRAGEALDAVFLALDEPFADASAVPTFLVSEATRKAVKVVLTGDGADEVFGGYRRYWAELHAGLWNRVPALLRRSFTSMLMRMPEGKDSKILEWVRRARRFASTSDPDPVRRQAAWMRLASEDELDRLLGRAPPHPIAIEGLIGELARQRRTESDQCDACLRRGLILPSDMLVKSIAPACECARPDSYLDQRVVEIAFVMP